jgi:hypothetical protein
MKSYHVSEINNEMGASDSAIWWPCDHKPNCWRVMFKVDLGFLNPTTYAVIDDFGNLVEVPR